MRRPRRQMSFLASAASVATMAQAKEFRSSDVHGRTEFHPLDYPTVQAVMYMGKLKAPIYAKFAADPKLQALVKQRSWR